MIRSVIALETQEDVKLEQCCSIAVMLTISKISRFRQLKSNRKTKSFSYINVVF